MIIELSDDFAALNSREWSKYLNALKNCIFAHRQGWHIFAPSRSVLNGIRTANILDHSEMQFLELQVESKLSTLIGQARSSRYTIQGRRGQGDGSTSAERHIKVDFEKFNDASLIQPSRLLVEDAVSDGQFIVELAKLLSNELGYFGPLNLEVVNGGGGGMDRLYSSSFDDFRPLVCVVDSDKRFANDRLGQTARKLLRVGSQNGAGTVRLVVWPCRELENLIPISFLFDVFANDGLVRSRVSAHYNFIKSRERCEVDLVAPFVDLKEGVREAEIKKYPSPTKEYFEQLAHQCGGANGHEDGVVRISANLVGMTLRLIQMEPRYRAKLKLKVERLPFFDLIAPVLELILAFGASLGRVPYRL